MRERHSLPGRVELGPACHAMDVKHHGLARQGSDLRPFQREWRLDLSPDAEVPTGQLRVLRRAPKVEDRELLGQDLAGWDALDDLRVGRFLLPGQHGSKRAWTDLPRQGAAWLLSPRPSALPGRAGRGRPEGG